MDLIFSLICYVTDASHDGLNMRTFLLCLISLFGLNSFSQPETVLLKPAVVTMSAGDQINSICIDSFNKEIVLGSSVSDLLSAQNLLYQRQASVNGPQTPGLRGLSSAQTAVIWNGIPVRNNMLGLTDLSLWSGTLTDRITVESGSASALNGNAAMGGTIHLQNDMDKMPQFKATAMYNSLQNLQAGVLAKRGIKQSILSIAYNTSLEQNHFKYSNPYEQNRQMWLEHAKSQVHQGLLQFKHRAGKYGHVTWRGMGVYANRQIPGNFVQPLSLAKLLDKQLRLNVEYKALRNNMLKQIRVAYLPEWNIYEDPKSQVNTTNQVSTFFANGDLWFYRNSGATFFKFLFNHSSGSSKNYNGAQKLVYSSLAGGHVFNKNRLSSRNTVQFTYSEQYLPFTIQSVNIWKVAKSEWMLQLANGFRMPTLNEQFWEPGGNPNIEPERSLHAEIGYRWVAEGFNYTGKAYFTPTLDYIVWEPIAPSVVSPRNMHSVTFVHGHESEFTVIRKGHLLSSIFRTSVHLNAVSEQLTINPAEQLDYVPLWRTLNECRLIVKNWQLSLSYQFIGSRNFQNEKLAPIHLLNSVWVLKKGKWQWVFSAQNLLNVHYQWIALQPMPGINFKFQITYQI